MPICMNSIPTFTGDQRNLSINYTSTPHLVGVVYMNPLNSSLLNQIRGSVILEVTWISTLTQYYLTIFLHLEIKEICAEISWWRKLNSHLTISIGMLLFPLSRWFSVFFPTEAIAVLLVGWIGIWIFFTF